MKKAFVLSIVAMVALPVYASRAAVVVVTLDFQEALDSVEIKSALGADVQFFLSGAKTPVIQKTFQAVGAASTTVRGSGTSQKNCRRVLLKVLQNFQNRARQQGGNAVVNIVSDYKNKEVANSSTIECYTGDAVMGHVTLRGIVAQVEK